MVNQILKELLDKKKISKQEFVSFLRERIKSLDDNSEKTIIGMNGKYIYDGYIGKNTLVQCSTVLLDGTFLDSVKDYIQFDGDERIDDLLYDSIQCDNPTVVVLKLVSQLLPLTLMDSMISGETPGTHDHFIRTNTQNGKVTKYSEIVNKKLSMCIEKAMLFHNICKILAIDSEIVCGTFEDDGEMELHAFNVLRVDSNIVVVDLAKALRKNKNHEYKLMSFPMFGIRSEQYNDLTIGKKIIGDMSYLTKIMGIDPDCEETHYLYGAGITEEDKNKMLMARLNNNKELYSELKKYLKY